MKQQFVLISGTSTGIGQATAHALAAKGYTVFAGVRKQADFAGLQYPNIRPLLLDVTDLASIDAAHKLVSDAVGQAGLHALINNAGVIYNTPFETMEEQKFRNLMEVNVFGVVRMSQKFLPLLQQSYKATGIRAKMVHISSIGGAIGLPWEFAYHVSKFGVNGLAQSQRFELDPLGIDVTAVMPGGIQTPIFDKGKASAAPALADQSSPNAAYYKRNLDAFSGLADKMYKAASTPQQAADVIARVVTAKRSPLRVRIGVDGKIMYLMARLLPASWVHSLLGGQMVKG